MLRLLKLQTRSFSSVKAPTHRDLLLSWLDPKDDTGFRGHFVSGEKRHDLDALVQNFTAPALARALRDREKLLAKCARLAQDPKKLDEVQELLGPFVTLGRSTEKAQSKDAEPLKLPAGGLLDSSVLRRLRTRLNRMPREITKRARRRASVILPLCEINGVPSVLFTQRSHNLRRHKGEVCFPGGLVDDDDSSIVDAGLRELEEETGIQRSRVQVLGVLRCDWSEVTAITGIAVTPVVGYLGRLESKDIKLNRGEVHNCFTVPIVDILDKQHWVLREYASPLFNAREELYNSVGQHEELESGGKSSKSRVEIGKEDVKIWGLTGYILHRFMKLLPSVVFDTDYAVSRSISFKQFHEDQ